MTEKTSKRNRRNADLAGRPFPLQAMSTKALNPGSREARDEGCTCPVLDNDHGVSPGPFGDDRWWINDGCPVHVPPVSE